MEETFSTQNRVAEGFSFYTDKDADMATLERKKIDYLEERMDYTQPESILKIYDKAIHDRVFKTPVGFLYLKSLQEYLLGQANIEPEQVVPIPLYQSYVGEVRETPNPAKNRVKPSDKKEAQENRNDKLKISIILNGLLVAAVIAMFAITLNSEQPNVLNYEKAIKNRYAAWEQELTEREQAVREKELKLHIEEE